MSYIGTKFTKPLFEEAVFDDDGNIITPAINQLEEYSKCAEWCNNNNAYIEDKEDYFEVVAIPEKTLDEVKEQKHSELKSTMQSKRQALKVDYDDDQFDANEDAQANMIVLLKSFDLGATSVSIRSTTEKTHTFNKEHTQELSLLMLQAVNELYDKYWELKDALSKCETVDAVNEIKWE